MPGYAVPCVLGLTNDSQSELWDCGRERERIDVMVANIILQAHLSICPILVTLPLPEAFCSCLLVALKAPCCPEHLKIYVVCFKLKWTSLSGTQSGECKCISTLEGKLAVLSPLREACLSSTWHTPGRFSTGQFDYLGFSP